MNTDVLEQKSVLQLTVHNHPGVMSHVCGLFARRAYNLDGIVCLPIGDGKLSRIYLLVNEDKKLEQVIRQTRKLVDVIEVSYEKAGSRGIVDLLVSESAQL